MYELNLNNHKSFCRTAKAKMKEDNISIVKLSKMTGYSIQTLNRFFQGRKSRFVAASIADALEINKEGGKSNE